MNTKIYGVDIRIQFEYRKIRTKKNSVFEHFSRSENFAVVMIIIQHDKTSIEIWLSILAIYEQSLTS